MDSETQNTRPGSRLGSKLAYEDKYSLFKALQSQESDSSIEMYELNFALDKKSHLCSFQSSLELPMSNLASPRTIVQESVSSNLSVQSENVNFTIPESLIKQQPSSPKLKQSKSTRNENKHKQIPLSNNNVLQNSLFSSVIGAFCSNCKKQVVCVPKDQPIGLWNQLTLFFCSLKQCGDPKSLSKHQAQACVECGQVLK